MMGMMHELPERFDDRNMFLVSLLGMLSLAQQLDELVAKRGRRVRPSTPGSAVEARARDHLLHALLGALALSQTVRAHTRVAQNDGEVRPRRVARGARAYRRLLV